MKNSKSQTTNKNTLVIGGTGKTGKRVVELLNQLEVPVRIGSRTATPAFDWEAPTTWTAALQGMERVYVTFYPDLAVPGAEDAIRQFTYQAKEAGVERLVLLSGRGEEEAQKCERLVQQSGMEWTILRASWFAQNFSEDFLYEMIMGGTVALPAGEVKEPFIDVQDIAEVAVAALTENGHNHKIYELTGPELLTLPEAITEIARALGREIQYVEITPEDFARGLEAEGVPEGMIWLLNYLFGTILDGRNSRVGSGVEQALGRPARSFLDYVHQTATSGAWNGEG